MELTLKAKTEKGKEALKRLFIDSKTTEGRAEMFSRWVNDDPAEVWLNVKKWPASARNNPGQLAGIKTGMYGILSAYGVNIEDVEVI